MKQAKEITSIEAIKYFEPFQEKLNLAESNKNIDGVIDLISITDTTSRPIKLYEGDVNVESLNMKVESNSIMVTGDLTVETFIKQDFRGGHLIVLGNLKAQNIITTGDIFIMGDLKVENILFGNCTNYFTSVIGNTKVNTLISSKGHLFCFYGSKTIETILDIGGDTPNLADAKYTGKNMNEIFVKDVENTKDSTYNENVFFELLQKLNGDIVRNKKSELP